MQATKEKLLKLWFENKKKAIEIIKDDFILTCKQPVVIDKGRTELYFDQRYDKPRSNLSAILDDYPECNDTEIPDFEPEQVPGGGNSTLIRQVYATGVLNLSPCSGVGKPKKDTLLWSYRSFLKSIVLYCIVLHCIALYCIVLYSIGDKDHVYGLLI